MVAFRPYLGEHEVSTQALLGGQRHDIDTVVQARLLLGRFGRSGPAMGGGSRDRTYGVDQLPTLLTVADLFEEFRFEESRDCCGSPGQLLTSRPLGTNTQAAQRMSGHFISDRFRADATQTPL